tara:strand:+ start:143630 stop:143845 length:216 start_codon:yes stop_codon:yes gene_type:complete
MLCHIKNGAQMRHFRAIEVVLVDIYTPNLRILYALNEHFLIKLYNLRIFCTLLAINQSCRGFLLCKSSTIL